MKFFALFPAKFSDLIDRTLKITQNTRRRGRSLRQCAQFRGFCSADGKTCAHSGQMCGPGGRFFRPAARRAGFLQEAEEKAAEKGSPPRGAGAQRLRGCRRFATADASGGPFFSVLPEKKGEKRGAWDAVWRILPLNLGKTLFFRCRSTRGSPHGCLTTRRMIRGYQICN